MASQVGKINTLLDRLTTPYWDEKEIPGDKLDAGFSVKMTRKSFNWRLLKVFDDKYWDQQRTNIDDFRTQMFPKQMTGGVLDEYGRAFGMARKVDESDAEYRLRIQGELKKRIGGTEPESILQFVENFLGADPGDVKLFENEDQNGDFQQGFLRVEFSDQLLKDLGFEEPFTDEIDQIEKILDRVAAAGVQTKVTLITGSTWDTASYDDSDVYGS